MMSNYRKNENCTFKLLLFVESDYNDIQLSFCRVIIGAPKADTSQYQQGVRQGGAVYRCDISDDNRCQIIHFDSNGKYEGIAVNSTNTNQTPIN